MKLDIGKKEMDIAVSTDFYVCPSCRETMRLQAQALSCSKCGRAYPLFNDTPEFISGDLHRSSDPALRRMRFIDKMAKIYETQLWYTLVMKLYGGIHSPTLRQLVVDISDLLRGVDGQILDVACGPGTFGRRVASESKKVWGVDVSRGMLEQGKTYAVREGIRNVHFARARVESLPFSNGVFNAAICCGSLHLFTDTVVALREIGRVMKPGGTLAVFTFTAGLEGILKYPKVREWSRRKHGLHVFSLPEVEQCLSATGFGNFRPKVTGSVLEFCATKVV